MGDKLEISRWAKNKKVILTIILFIGLLTSGLLIRGKIPFYPQDLISYIGGFYAFSDGENPYDLESVKQSLSQRAIISSSDRFVYPPPFLLLFLPLQFLSYTMFRLIWIVTALLSAWLALWLLASRLKGLYSLLFALMGALFFTVAATLHDSLFWGQITPVMLLAVLVLGAAVFGPMSYGNWFDSISAIGKEWGYARDNNLSIARGVCTFTDRWVHQFDEQRAMADDEYRLDSALRIRNSDKNIYQVVVVLLTFFCAVRLFAGKRSGRKLNRDSLLAAAVLYLLVVIPFIWLHYGLFLIFPLWTLLRRRRIKAAVLFFVTAMFWGMPICSPSIIGSIDWLRFLIPLFWLIYFMFASEETPDHYGGII
ncbi:MAG: glycosyltransferase 87 family protein [Candidatus Fermentibacteria bacterium]